MNKYLYEKGARKTELCENFGIKGGKAYCSAHEKKDRSLICQNYFCGDTNPIFRFKWEGDETLRKIAETLGTAPVNYSIPKLPSKNILEFLNQPIKLNLQAR
jgi:hypothetical protein